MQSKGATAYLQFDKIIGHTDAHKRLLQRKIWCTKSD